MLNDETNIIIWKICVVEFVFVKFRSEKKTIIISFVRFAFFARIQTLKMSENKMLNFVVDVVVAFVI